MEMTPGWFLVIFFLLGWAYYMVATILMRGSIFAALRGYVDRKGDSNRFFRLLQSMLGCMMCTATEACLWTLGLSTFALGVYYRFPDMLVTSAVNQPAHLHIVVEVMLMGMISFALSLAVAGEAWAIKTLVEHREMKFLMMRSELRQREMALLDRIQACETATTNQVYDFDLSIPEEKGPTT